MASGVTAVAGTRAFTDIPLSPDERVTRWTNFVLLFAGTLEEAPVGGENFDPLRPQKPPRLPEDFNEKQRIPLTPEMGLQTRSLGGGLFEQIQIGVKYLWTIDSGEIRIAIEKPAPPGIELPAIKHTNVSPNSAFFGGEVTFLSETEVELNPYSGRYGVGNPLSTEADYMRAIQDWQDLGYTVHPAPYGR